MSFDVIRELALSIQGIDDAKSNVVTFIKDMNDINLLFVDISIKKESLNKNITKVHELYRKKVAEYENKINYCALLADENISLTPKSINVDNIELMPIEEFFQKNGRITAAMAERMPHDDLLKYRMEFEVEQLEKNTNILDQKKQKKEELQKELATVKRKYEEFILKMESMYDEILKCQKKLLDNDY